MGIEATPRPSSDTDAGTAAARVPHRWRNLATLTGVSMVDSTEGSLANTLFPSISAALRLDSGHLGVLAALGKIVAVPFGPAWVWLAGRIGRRAAIVGSTVVAGAFGAAAGFAQNWVQLLVFNTLMSAAIIGSAPIANAVITDSFDDRNRGRAVGYFYGVITLFTSLMGQVIALFTGLTDGWRYGMWTISGLCVAAGLAVALFFTDPGVGAAEKQLADLADRDRVAVPVTTRSVLSLFRIPTFSVMMLSRLLSGHLLIGIFGVQFLVTERGFTNAVAAVVLLPFGIGYFVGTVGGGWLLALLDRVLPDRGRVAYLQAAQVLFAVLAFFGTQFDYGNIGVYAVFWALLGAAQGLNPPVNRPIVAAVILPELRGQAFAVFLAVFETIGWAVFSLGAGQFADSHSIQTVFLWTLVGLMLVNAAVLTVLYTWYPRDARRVTDELARRRVEALS
jgi:MFS family permease